MKPVKHGTYAGWNWHNRNDVPVCLDCKEAARQRQAEWRATNEAGRAKEREGVRARSRALTRLGRMYPADYQRLLTEELSAK